jgi:ABC-2 type transport system permease protein
MPDPVLWLRDLLPSTYGVEALAEALSPAADWTAVAGRLAVCAAAGAAALALATWAYRRAAGR